MKEEEDYEKEGGEKEDGCTESAAEEQAPQIEEGRENNNTQREIQDN